jgi:hypothetical protein
MDRVAWVLDTGTDLVTFSTERVMDIESYLALMHFHPKWKEYGLVPADQLQLLMESYEPGMEDASEHDRNGVFHWWLKQSPSKDVLLKLVELSYLDADQLMADDVRRHITKSERFDSEVAQAIAHGAIRER